MLPGHTQGLYQVFYLPISGFNTVMLNLFSGNINIYLYFLSFLITKVVNGIFVVVDNDLFILHSQSMATDDLALHRIFYFEHQNILVEPHYALTTVHSSQSSQ